MKTKAARFQRMRRSLLVCLASVLAAMLPAGICEAASGQQVTAEDKARFVEWFERNSIDELLSRHTAIRIDCTYYQSGDTFSHYSSDWTHDMATLDVDTGFSYIYQNGKYLELTEDGGIWEMLIDSGETYQKILDERKESALGNIEGRTLTGIQEENGLVTMQASVTSSRIVKEWVNGDYTKGRTPYEYQAGMTILYRYVYDAATGDLQEMTRTLREKDGTEELYDRVALTYDGDAYDVAASPFADYFTEDQFKTVTVVYEADTSNAYTMVYQVPMGIAYDVNYRGKLPKTIYWDADFTQVVEKFPLNEDAMVYVKSATFLERLAAGEFSEIDEPWYIDALLVVYYVIFCAACWKLFGKAGEKGWKALVPLYNEYVLFGLVWKKKRYWDYLSCVIATSVIGALLLKGMDEGRIVLTLGLFVLVLLGALLCYCVYRWKLAKAYGRGAGFALGLILLPPVFELILGFGGARYVGASGQGIGQR